MVEWNRRGTSRKWWTLWKKVEKEFFARAFFLFPSPRPLPVPVFVHSRRFLSSFPLGFGLDPQRTPQLLVYTQAYRDHDENNCGGVKSHTETFPPGKSWSRLLRLTRFPTASRFLLKHVRRFYESCGCRVLVAWTKHYERYQDCPSFGVGRK